MHCDSKESPDTTVAIRKGPWLAEEDEVLMEYVRKHGPRDWSSIRSKGLLPRTGKSCRLRWVNKLKPDLKSGCKFSAEEERIVIDMQSRFGNKWAKIATFLPGRTDNDVKNFWSTRQKRLARLLQTPLPVRSHRRQGKAPMFPEIPNFEPNSTSNALPYDLPCPDLIQFRTEFSIGQCSHAPYIEAPDFANSLSILNIDSSSALFEPAMPNSELCVHSSSPPKPQFDPSLLINLPLLPESQDLGPEFDDMSFAGQFGCAENSQAMEIPMAPEFFDVGAHGIKIEQPGTPESLFGDFPDVDVDVGGHCVKIEQPGTPESFFGDFPTDMFDCLDQPPAS